MVYTSRYGENVARRHRRLVKRANVRRVSLGYMCVRVRVRVCSARMPAWQVNTVAA